MAAPRTPMTTHQVITTRDQWEDLHRSTIKLEPYLGNGQITPNGMPGLKLMTEMVAKKLEILAAAEAHAIALNTKLGRKVADLEQQLAEERSANTQVHKYQRTIADLHTALETFHNKAAELTTGIHTAIYRAENP